MDSDNVSYVIGYWRIPGNVKNNLAHYQRHLINTFKLLANKKVVFFYENVDDLSIAQKNCKQLKEIYLPHDELFAHQYAQIYLDNCKSYDPTRYPDQFEKGKVHYHRDLIRGGAENYKKIFAVWFSKLDLVRKVIDDNPFETEYFAWVDASVSRFNNCRRQWNFTKVPVSKQYIQHYGNMMRYHGHVMSINASMLRGHKDAMLQLIELFYARLKEKADDIYPHDEETILQELVNDCQINKIFTRID